MTEAGKTARLLSSLRPHARHPRRDAASGDRRAALALVWGVTPVVTGPTSLDAVRDRYRRAGTCRVRLDVVFVSMRPLLDRDGTNFVGVERF